MKTNAKETQLLKWYYPLEHENNVSFIKKIFNKIMNISFNYRIKKYEIFKKTIPYPTIRMMSDDILGNARSKVAPKFLFVNKSQTIQIDIENRIERNDILRLKGLFLTAKNFDEAGPSILEYRKNKNEEWKRIGLKEFIIGKSTINDIHPKRFIRILDNHYTFALDIKTGKYPTIEKNGKLVIKLSNSIQANWSTVDEHMLIVKDKNNRKIIGKYHVIPEVAEKNILFPIHFNIPANSHLIIPTLKIKSTSGSIDRFSTGSLSIYTELSGNFDSANLKKETQLGGTASPLKFIYPKMNIDEQDLMFYLDTEKEPEVSIRINIDEISSFYKGDIIRIHIPKMVDLNWGNNIPRIKQKGFRIRKTGNKTIEVNIFQTINKDIILDKIPFIKPSNSIPPFTLKASFSFAPETVLIPISGDILFGQPKIAMAHPKLVNQLKKDACLHEIIITEDDSVTTLKTGDIIEIICSKAYFSFNRNRLSEIKILNKEGSNNHKIGIDFNNQSMDRIVLHVREDLNTGEVIHIHNLPITDIDKLGSVFLKYNLNNKSTRIDDNEIKIINLSLELDKNIDFVRDINKQNNSFSIDGITIKLKGEGKIFNQEEHLILSLPEETGKWVKHHNVAINSPAGEFKIRKNDSQHLTITTKKAIFNEANLSVENLFIQPVVNEFIDMKLTLTSKADSTVSDQTSNRITYSYPSLRSLDDQMFFNDDTSWYLYNVNISTRNLNNTISSGSRISLILNNKNIEWDMKYNNVNIKGENAEKLNTFVEFDGQICSLIANETIKSNMFFEISGLRIKPVSNPDIDFKLGLSLDEGRTICAKDYRSKFVKSNSDYSGKRERSIKESSYAMKSMRSWKIKIPDSLDYQWNTAKNQINPVIIKNIGKSKSGINDKSISPKVEFVNNKTAEIKIVNGYGTIDMGLGLSGASPKKLYFSGLELNPITEIKQSNSEDYLNLIIETPYGTRLIHSYNSGVPDWGIKINGKKSFSLNQLSGKELEVEISTSQVKKFGKQGILDVTRLDLYTNEKTLLFNSLVKNINNTNKNKAKIDVIATLEYINKYFDDTDPKGKDWKVWYYLAYAKWQANELGILDELYESKWLRDDRSLTKGRYYEDMEKAIRKGYQPDGRHENYPLIKKGNLLAEVNNKIKIAEGQYIQKYLIKAEQDLLMILNDIKKYDEISHRAAVVNYWLGRIALDLGDIEYDNYKSSYPYRKFYKARKIYKNNEALFSSEPWLEDSINVYKDLAKSIVKNNIDSKSIPLKYQSGEKESSLEGVENTCRFTYNYDNNYTYRIKGETGSAIGLVNVENPETNLAQGDKLSPGFDDEIRLEKGGDYKVEFSPKKQSFYNYFTTVIILSLIGIIYG